MATGYSNPQSIIPLRCFPETWLWAIQWRRQTRYRGDGFEYRSYAGDGLSVFTNNGDGTFAPRVEYETGVNAAAVAVGDFDLDGNWM